MNCSIATPGCMLKITRCMSLLVFAAAKNVFKSCSVDFGDKSDKRTRLSSNGPSTTGCATDGVISVTCTHALLIVNGALCATRPAAVTESKQYNQS